MGWFKRFLGPRNGVILVFDHLEGKSFDEFESQVEEVTAYYEFVKVSEIVARLKTGGLLGMAAVAFQNARKSVFLRGIPWLSGRGIPSTVFCSSDSIGMNRLPIEDELMLYRQYFPKVFSEESYRQKREEAWARPGEVRQFLDERPKAWGPLPYDLLDPTYFFSTWKQVIEVSPDRLEVGFSVESTPQDPTRLEESLAFVRRQVGRDVSVAFTARMEKGLESWLSTVKIEGLVTPRQGALDKATSPLELPQFQMEKVQT